MSEHCEIDKEKFGAFLARLRKEKGLTQKELAERLFVSDKAVSKWERSLSLPDVALLLPLADCLGVSVTELLRGERTTQPQLPVEEVEALVGSALRMGGEEQAERRTDRRRWRLACVLCVLAGAAETLALRALGFSWAELGPAVLLVEGMSLVFALWLCFWVKERLPAYYDENRISIYSDGVFRLSLPGVHINNSNWPHILRAMRVWLLGAMVLLPLLWGALAALWPGRLSAVRLALVLVFCLGLFVPAMLAARRHA